MENRIAFVMPSLLPFPPVKGGAVETLVDGLIKENERCDGYAFTVCAIWDEAAVSAAREYTGTRFIFIRTNGLLHAVSKLFRRIVGKLFGFSLMENYEYALKAYNALRDGRWNAIVVENDIHYACYLNRRLRGAAIVYLHLHNDLLNTIPTRTAKRILADGMRFICVSRYIQGRVLSIEAKPRAWAYVLENCIDTKIFAPGRNCDFREQFRRENQIGPDGVVFLFTGRIIREKGALEAAQAFRILNDARAWLLVVGSAWFSQDTDDQYTNLLRKSVEPVRNRVLFTGYVPHTHIQMYYAAADVAVLPSLWEEPAGLTVLESLAAGLPVIMTRSGGAIEVANERCTIVLDRRDDLVNTLCASMRQLLNDAELRARMGRAAREAVSARDYSTYYDTFTEILSLEEGKFGTHAY